jgi:hypothetical protein
MRTQVVSSSAALHTHTVRYTRLNCHALAHSALADIRSNRNNHPSGFVTKNEWLTNDIGTNPTVLIVVNIRSTDPDCLDLNKHIPRSNFRHGPLFQTHIVWSI